MLERAIGEMSTAPPLVTPCLKSLEDCLTQRQSPASSLPHGRTPCQRDSLSLASSHIDDAGTMAMPVLFSFHEASQ